MSHEDYKEMLTFEALTALDGEDQRALENHLPNCIECSGDLNVWQATASALAYAANPLEPSPELRVRILERAHQERLSAPAAKVIELKPKAGHLSGTFQKLGAIAATVIFVSLLAAVIFLWQQNRQAKTDVLRLSSQISDIQRALSRERGALAALTRPGTRINELSGTKDAPDAHAVLAFDAKSGRAVLVARGLPPAPAGKAYQLWFMVGSRPVPGKVFNVDVSGNAIADDQLPPEALSSTVFAVTLEVASGVATPTLPILLLTPPNHSTFFADPALRTTFSS